MSAQSTFHVKLSGPGISLDREVTESVCNRIMLFVLSGGESDSQRQPPVGAVSPKGTAGEAASKPNKNQSIREYLLANPKAKKIPQQMTVIGNYLAEVDGKEWFSLSELKQGFDDAKEGAPGNPHRDLGKAIRAGWIAKKKMEVRTPSANVLHDRYLTDDATMLILGTSLNSFGKKQCFVIQTGTDIRGALMVNFDTLWAAGHKFP